MWIDISAKDKRDAEKVVEIGDYITYQTQPLSLNQDFWTSKALDDKVGLLMLIELAKALDGKLPAMDVYFVATVNAFPMTIIHRKSHI